MLDLNDFTPTQRRILKVLADGMPHTRKEIHACLNDELCPLSAIQQHITLLRKRLRPLGQDIICELNSRIYYRHVRLIASSYD